MTPKALPHQGAHGVPVSLAVGVCFLSIPSRTVYDRVGRCGQKAKGYALMCHLVEWRKHNVGCTQVRLEQSLQSGKSGGLAAFGVGRMSPNSNPSPLTISDSWVCTPS